MTAPQLFLAVFLGSVFAVIVLTLAIVNLTVFYLKRKPVETLCGFITTAPQAARDEAARLCFEKASPPMRAALAHLEHALREPPIVAAPFPYSDPANPSSPAP